MSNAISKLRHSKICHLLRYPKPAERPKRLLRTVVLSLLLIGIENASAQEQDIRYSATTGVDYSNGSYGTSRNTNVLLGITALGAEIDNIKFNVSIPYIRISGRGLVVFDASGNPIVINRHTSLPPDVRTGFGDVNLSATYTIPAAILDGFEVELSGGAKIPTGSERRRLSTGEADYGLSVDVSHQFGIWGPFLKVGYLIPGEPATYQLYNTTSVSTGTSVELSDDVVAVASYDYDSVSTPLVDASHELFGSLSWLPNDSIVLTGYGTVGLSSGSPGFGGGLLVSYNFK